MLSAHLNTSLKNQAVNGLFNAFQQDFKNVGGVAHSVVDRSAGVLDNLTNPVVLLAIAGVAVIIVMNKK